MASSFPNLGHAPSLPSRIVTVDLAEAHIGQPETGAKVDFTLPQDIHVRADGVIVQAGTVTLELDESGRGEIRLPCYSSASKPEDWVILVKKHWAPYPYPIRVPAGNTKISLASLEPPVEVSDAMSKFAVTDVSLEVETGAALAGSSSVDGGIANLKLTIPNMSSAAAWAGTPLGTTDLDSVTTPGVYTQQYNSNATADRNYPTRSRGTLTVTSLGGGLVQQAYQPAGSAMPITYMRVQASSVWGPWQSSAASTYREMGLLSDQNLDAVTAPGTYTQQYNAAATTERNYPLASAGTLTVALITEQNAVILQTYIATNGGVYTRRHFSGTWSNWLPSYVPRPLTSENLDAVTAPGTYTQRYNAAATTERNYPLASAGTLTVTIINVQSGLLEQRYDAAYMAQIMVRRRSNNEWSAWYPAVPDIHVHQRAVTESEVRKRVGKIVHSEGRAVVAMIFDHGPVGFRDVVLPALQAANLPCTWALNGGMFEPDYLHRSEVGDVTWGIIKEWIADNPIEIANHSYSHRGAASAADIYREIVGGKTALEAALGVPVDSYVNFGVPTGGNDLQGFDPKDPYTFAKTLAGRLILDNHFAHTGDVAQPGFTYLVDGTFPIGADGEWLDNRETQVRAMIERAISRGERCIVRCHPGYIGADGLITPAAFQAFIAWLADRVSDGEVLPVTFSEWAIATL